MRGPRRSCIKRLVHLRRLLLLVASAVAAAAVAPPAGAQILLGAGLLVQTSGAVTALSLNGASGTGTASLTIFVPTGFGLRLDRPPGAKIGRAALSLSSAADPSGLGADAEGPVVVADPARYVGDPRAACAPGTHLAVWRLEPLDVPVFVDRASGPDSALGGHELRICFDLREGLAFRGLSLELERTVVAPSLPGLYAWRAFLTPRTPSGAADAGGTYETRSVVAWPAVLTLRARRAGPTRALLYGRLLLASRPRARATVRVVPFTSTEGEGSLTVTIGRSLSARTDRAGRFRLRVRVRRTTEFVALWFAFPRDTCSSPSPAPAGCVGESTSPALSGRVVVRRRR